jgi:hypothetical protein
MFWVDWVLQEDMSKSWSSGPGNVSHLETGSLQISSWNVVILSQGGWQSNGWCPHKERLIGTERHWGEHHMVVEEEVGMAQLQAKLGRGEEGSPGACRETGPVHALLQTPASEL